MSDARAAAYLAGLLFAVVATAGLIAVVVKRIVDRRKTWSRQPHRLMLAFLEAFRNHGIRSEIHGQSVEAPEQGLRMTPILFRRGESGPGNEIVQLDVIIDSPAFRGREMGDSCAGVGDTVEQAWRSAFERFLLGTFHVVVEALTTHRCDSRQVEWEQWTGPHGTWRVCSGPLVTRGDVDSRLSRQYAPVLAGLKALLCEQLGPGSHWMRFYVESLDGEILATEAILDDETWVAGEALLSASAWTTAASGSDSIRHVLIALPAAPDAR